MGKIKNLALSPILAAVAAGCLTAVAQTDTNTAATNAPPATTNADQAAPPVVQAPPATNAVVIAETNDAAEITPTNAVRMNFHDVPLNTVLNYLAARMGFVINSDNVDVARQRRNVGERTAVPSAPMMSSSC